MVDGGVASSWSSTGRHVARADVTNMVQDVTGRSTMDRFPYKYTERPLHLHSKAFDWLQHSVVLPVENCPMVVSRS